MWEISSKVFLKMAAERGRYVEQSQSTNIYLPDPNDQQLHFTDYWKTPTHATFSRESKYATEDAPHWEGDKLIDKDGRVIYDDAAQRR